MPEQAGFVQLGECTCGEKQVSLRPSNGSLKSEEVSGKEQEQVALGHSKEGRCLFRAADGRCRRG